MLFSRLNYSRYLLSLCLSALLLGANSTEAQQAMLADSALKAGSIWQADGSAAELVVHQRSGSVEPAFPEAEKNIAQLAISSDEKIYFCSGLDGYVIHLINGKHEVAAFAPVKGQIRDLACTGEKHTIYYSVVETPVNKQNLSDGQIFRRDIEEGKETLVATIRQADVGGNWWGVFTIHEGSIYLATSETDSRILKWTKGAISEVALLKGYKIEGLTVAPDTSFQFVCGNKNIYCTADFKEITSSETNIPHLSDIAFPASSDSQRPLQ